MKILLTGRNGQVGWELERALPALGEVIATDRSTLNLSDPDAIRKLIREVKPSVIVNAAAYTAVDKAESEPELAMQVNGIAPGILAEEAKRLGALLVHYSTDYVFDGRKRTPYVEEDPPNPLSVYGRSKLAGETAVREAGEGHLVLRLSWVYAPRGRNFLLTILKKAAAGERLRIVNDQTGVPTSAEFAASSTVSLIKRDATGLLHLVPGGSATWFDFACEALELAGHPATPEPIISREWPTAATRPTYSVLSNARAAGALGDPLPDWRSLLRRAVDSLH